MKLLKYYKLTGQIELLSGLHVGGNKDTIEIGGIDNPVIKDVRTGKPYIPGSSIKGKMRFLLEWKLERVSPESREPCDCGDCPVCKIFGNTNPETSYGPTRIKVNDCNIILNEDEEEAFKNQELDIFEDKVENRINRLTGAAISPRHMERVSPGYCFDFSLTYKIFQLNGEGEENTEDKKNWDHVVNALYYLQEDGLGGSTSRGYGSFQFNNLELNGQPRELQWNGKKAELIEI